jgi:tRNA(fMet)-specific endonuclease VapC
MTGNDAALDTNWAIDILNGRPGIHEWITGFSRLLLPVPVVGELRYGALHSRRAHDNLKRVDSFIATCQTLDLTARTAETYATIRLALTQAGRPIPENDVWIAAICIEHTGPLATHDSHFEAIAHLQIIRS